MELVVIANTREHYHKPNFSISSDLFVVMKPAEDSRQFSAYFKILLE